ncbi:transposase domain-containing protein, partial [Piscirickettsia litoralis]|uniref:transposase domain-containing protein n=1 Tax=Piscirickettsia litoralis TaxID=1891921 RepID=UPI001F3D0483
VGRHNWMFSATEAGAKATAVFYSLVATCKLNGKIPYHYLKQLFENIRAAKTNDELSKLLPYCLQKVTLPDERDPVIEAVV